MAKDYQAMAKDIVEKVGGLSNITSATHCMTRLRLTLKDESAANDTAVEAIAGVKSVIKQGGQYQVVIGQDVNSVYAEVAKLGDLGGDAAPAEKQGIVNTVLGYIAGCMTPLFSGMLGAGMIKVILVLLTSFAGLSEESSTYIILNAVGDGFFVFLPILLGYSIAQRLKGSAVLYMTVGAFLVYPDLVAYFGNAEALESSLFGMPAATLFGIPVIATTYTSSVLPMLLMGPVMKWAEDFSDRVSPVVLKAFMKPMLFLIISAPIALVLLGPLGGLIGNWLAAGVSWLLAKSSWLTIAVLAGLMPFIVMTGMHWALIPLALNSFATTGVEPFLITTMFAANIAQGGAAFGVALKTKNGDLRSEGIASGISATIAGVTEPAMYGINLRFVKPMIAVVIAATTTGLLLGIFNMQAYAMGGSPSFFSIPTLINPDDSTKTLLIATVAGLLSLALSFAITLVLYKDDAETAGDAPATGTAAPLDLAAPMTGQVVAIEDVPDAVFASGALGAGVAIIPADGKVVAPADATVSALMQPSKHAIGLTLADESELLIHVGLDTVQLDGSAFEYHVSEGQAVKAGDLLMTANLDAIKAAGKQIHTPVLVPNPGPHADVALPAAGPVTAGQPFITLA